jgi:uncharacterized repeat protein (TIGR02543 family)
MHIILKYKDETKEDIHMTGLYEQTLRQNGYRMPDEPYYWSSKSGAYTRPGKFYFNDYKGQASTTDRPDDTLVLTETTSDLPYKMIHYKQRLDGSYPDIDQPDSAALFSGGTLYLGNPYKGFTLVSYKTAEDKSWLAIPYIGYVSGYKDFYFRHQRNSYTLTFKNGSNTEKTETVLYEGPLVDFQDYVPERPAELPERYVFEGWYLDENLNDKADLTTMTMPYNNLILFAKWVIPQVNVTVYLQKDGGEHFSYIKEYGTKIDKNSMPVVKDSQGNVVYAGNGEGTVLLPDNHYWMGWVVKENNISMLYDFDEPIVRDIEIYPYYAPNINFKLQYKYLDNDGVTQTIIDDKNYAHDSYAKIASGVTGIKGKKFVGWSLSADGSGDMLYPNDKVLMDNNYTLYAVFTEELPTVSLIYDGNGGKLPNGKTQQEITDIQVNSVQTVLDNTKANNLGFKRNGYEIVGWEYKYNGQSVKVKAGDHIMVNDDESEDNILTAIWEKSKNPANTTEPNKPPKTGDTSEYCLWITVMAVSAGLIMFNFKKNIGRKKNN